MTSDDLEFEKGYKRAMARQPLPIGSSPSFQAGFLKAIRELRLD